MYALFTVYARALDAQQHTQVERRPVGVRRATVAAYTVAWHTPQYAHGAVGGGRP